MAYYSTNKYAAYLEDQMETTSLKDTNDNQSYKNALNYSLETSKLTSNGDDYQFVKNLGKGTYGVVNEVKFKPTGISYAMKTYITANLNSYESYTGDLLQTVSNTREIDFLSQITHPNITKAHKLVLKRENLNNGNNFISSNIIMDLADDNLENYIKNNALNKETKLNFIYSILSAYNFIHEHKYVHCDVKLDNILVKDGIVMVADPGFIVNEYEMPVVLDSQFICGTVLYRSPELTYYNKKLSSHTSSLTISNKKQINEWLSNYNDNVIKHTKLPYYISKYNKIPFSAIKNGEMFSIGKVILYIYINNIFEYNKSASAYWMMHLHFYVSSLPLEDRISELKKLPGWPVGDDAIEGMDTLIAKLLDGNPLTRLVSFDAILSSDVFTNNNYTEYISGKINNLILPEMPETDVISNDIILLVVSVMVKCTDELKLLLYHLYKALSLFHTILKYAIDNYKAENLTTKLHGAAIISIFLVIGRTNNHNISLGRLIKCFNKHIEFILNKEFIIFLIDIYDELGGVVLFESTFDYASSGNVDYRAIRYYADFNLMRIYSPSQYIEVIEKEYLNYKNQKIANKEPVINLSKSSYVHQVYPKMINLLK